MPTVTDLAGPPRQLTGLTPGTAYRVRVRATNGAGASAWSAWVPFETSAGSGTTTTSTVSSGLGDGSFQAE